ncbi:MAG: hypothetical protein H6815_08985 [Phycisphaeraceae bacterium]|nr:hypothetical protein [Phycisphaerales bacterium]MCB9860575.1 hypothetical protein [Phycisphaeraceae bacterium]
MTENEFQARLEELVGKIDTLDPKDQDRLRKLAEETKARHNRMKKSVAELQESLDYLRVSVKYLVFDLEATRRENQYLRKLIDTTEEN